MEYGSILGSWHSCLIQGALSERQQILPEVMKNGDDENPLKVSVRYLTEVFPEVTGKKL